MPPSLSGWSPTDLLPGAYVLCVLLALAAVLRRWFDPVPTRVLMLFALLLAVLFGPVLCGGRILLPLENLRANPPFQQLPPPDRPGVVLQGDLVHQIVPWSIEVRRAFAAGRWPLWNVRAGAGMPLLADPQSQALQPLVLAAYPFDPWAAAGVTAALRVLTALVFFFLLLARQGLSAAAATCGAAAYALGGFVMLWLGWPMANGAVLLPAVLYALVRCDEHGGRRDLLLLALSTAALLLGGHPETILYALALSGLFLLARVAARRRAGTARGAALR
nr:hypothetical protein [Acidobacteriota bacterium]